MAAGVTVTVRLPGAPETGETATFAFGTSAVLLELAVTVRAAESISATENVSAPVVASSSMI